MRNYQDLAHLGIKKDLPTSNEWCNLCPDEGNPVQRCDLVIDILPDHAVSCVDLNDQDSVAIVAVNH